LGSCSSLGYATWSARSPGASGDGAVLLRVGAFVSLVLGVYGLLAALSVWGAVTGAVMGALALLFAWAALTERPDGWTRRVARAGMLTGGLALIVCAIWVVLAILGV
jgi:hypothetical protein